MTLIDRLFRSLAVATWQFGGALVVGVATIFVMKNDPREHWAIPPTSRIEIVLDEAGHPDGIFDPTAFTEVDGLRWPRALLA
jgi:hypothetical protein